MTGPGQYNEISQDISQYNDLFSDEDFENEFEYENDGHRSFYINPITPLMRYGIEDISNIAETMFFLENLEEEEFDLVLNESFEQTLSQNNVKNTDKILNIKPTKFNNKYSCIECCVCITKFEINDEVIEINCKHLFHNDCIKEWYKYKDDCPLCRSKI